MDEKPTLGVRRGVVLAVLATAVVLGAVLPAVALADEQLVDGGTYWQGQTLTYGNGLSQGDTVHVVTDPGGQYRSESVADANGVSITTTDLDGDYRLERPDGTVLATFAVDVATLSVGPTSTSVDADGPDPTVDLTLSSNRPDAAVEITADSLSNVEVAQMFGSGTVALDANGQAAVTGDVSDVDPGTYQVDFTMTDVPASTAATVEVTGTTTDGPTTVQASTPSGVTAVSPPDPGDGTEEPTATERPTDEPTATATPEPTATAPSRGFLTNGEEGPLSNVFNLTFLGFLLSALGIVYQLVEGR